MGKHKLLKPLDDTAPFVSREALACPGGKSSHQDRLNASEAIDLRDNLRMERISKSFIRAVPIDKSRHHKP